MGWQIVVTLRDAHGTVLATETSVDPRDLTWKIPVKLALARAELAHPAVAWTRASVVVERA